MEGEVQGGGVNQPSQQQQQQQDGMKAKARNMALFLTLLGAAYKVNAGEIHIDEETMEVAKSMMIKLGLAGSLVKAGQMTIVKKEKGEHSDSDGEEKHEERDDGESEGLIKGYPTNPEMNAMDSTPRRRNDRSSSMGSLEDLSNMIKHPSAIASRLYNAFQSPNSSTTNLDSVEEQSGSSNNAMGGNGVNEASPRKHRGKRSHFLRIDELKSGEEALSMEGPGGKSGVEPPTPEASSNTAKRRPHNVRNGGGGGGSGSLRNRPIKQHQRPPLKPSHYKPKNNNLKREYKIRQSQTLLLLITATISFLLFLLFTLPFYALVGLTMMTTFLGLGIVVATSALKTPIAIVLIMVVGTIAIILGVKAAWMRRQLEQEVGGWGRQQI
eukprot:scaffold5003_cov69-Skeletonema_menzelii.AAC.1